MNTPDVRSPAPAPVAAATRAGAAPAPPHGAGPGAGAGITLFTVGLGTLVTLMAFTAPSTTLTATARGLHAGPVAQTWIFTGTPVGLAALLLVLGSAADARGRRRVFGAGALMLTLASALSAAAPVTAVFLAGRVLQGAGSAAVLAAGLGLIAHTRPAGPHRVRALGIWGATLGGAIATGPVYAALITQLLGWRSLYWGLALLSAAALALTAAVPESRADEPRRLDVRGALTLAAGTAALVAGFGEGRSGWLRPLVLALLAAGALLLALFAVVERRVAAPTLDPALWRSPAFLAAGVGALVTGLSVIGLMSYLPTVLQISLGMSPLAASLLLVVWSGLSVVSALQARRLAPYATATTQVALGLLLSSVGQAMLCALRAGGSPARLLPGLAIAGVGSGVLNAALARLAVSSVPADRSAMGSGANNTARYVGSALGLALTVAVVTSGTRPTTHPAATLATGTHHAALLSAALSLTGAAVVLWLGRRTGRAPKAEAVRGI
jgi:MFS family permease